MAAGDIRWQPRAGNPVTVMSTELDALAAAAGVLSAAVDADADQDTLMDLLLSVTFASAPTADTVITCYVVRSIGDGTYEDGSSASIAPADGLVGYWRVRNVNTIQRLMIRGVEVPPHDFKLLVVNGTNQAFPANGSTVQAAFYKEHVDA